MFVCCCRRIKVTYIHSLTDNFIVVKQLRHKNSTYKLTDTGTMHREISDSLAVYWMLKYCFSDYSTLRLEYKVNTNTEWRTCRVLVSRIRCIWRSFPVYSVETRYRWDWWVCSNAWTQCSMISLQLIDNTVRLTSIKLLSTPTHCDADNV